MIRFRTYEGVVSYDIKMMYRQVLVDPEKRSLQRILWRAEPTEKLKEYNLNTVMYGTVCAFFLAIQCLMESAKQYEETNMEIARIYLEDFYVHIDDMLTGGDTVEDVIEISKQGMYIPGTGGFELSKWSSNSVEVLDAIKNRNESTMVLNFGLKENTKTLGLRWSGAEDVIKYSFNNFVVENRVTYCQILCRYLIR